MEIEQLKHVGTKQERSCEFKFESHDEQTQKDANELAAILSRKNKCEYKVLVDLSCVAVINDSKIETNE